MKYREIVKRKKQETKVLYYECELLYILVKHFKNPYYTKLSKYKFIDLRRYRKKKYHLVNDGPSNSSKSYIALFQDSWIHATK